MIPVTVVLFLLLVVSEGNSIVIQIVNTSCSQGSNDCITLGDCLNATDTCFASHSRYNFSNRVYNVTEGSGFFLISNAENLSLFGSGATINCMRSVGFAFLNMTGLQITGIGFNMCGSVIPMSMHSDLFGRKSFGATSFYMHYGTRVAILLADTYRTILQNLRINWSYGYGLVATNPQGLDILNSFFSYNNFHALPCFHNNSINTSCCAHLTPDATTTTSNCSGGNLVIISQDHYTRHPAMFHSSIINI